MRAKRLEWHEMNDEFWRMRAPTPFGYYLIFHHGSVYHEDDPVHLCGADEAVDFDALMELAQADFERRIMSAIEPITVDQLAAEIRRVDGNNSLGAGALAEALLPFLKGEK